MIVNKLRRLWIWMVGDCADCRHSIVYHLPFVGCTKCDCEEFH